ncbi:MAG: hypothetical protein ABIS67_08180 [Candidatus Eisenbacteria bacterium]
MASDAAVMTADETRVLERLADRVVELRMELPAVLTLETARPLSLVAGQAMIFFEPLVQALFRVSDYRLYASLIERRECIEALARMIETRADDAHATRRAARERQKPPA